MRYLRNFPLISEEKQREFHKKTLAIVGLGGLGGYLANGALRLGFTNLILIDKDIFETTDLNRQLFCTEDALGLPKVEVVKKELLRIYPKANLLTHYTHLDKSSVSILQGADLVLDALDNKSSRLDLEKICVQLGIPMIHGAIDGWNAQVAFLSPEKEKLHLAYGQTDSSSKTNMVFVASFVASLQLILLTKYFLEDSTLRKNLLFRFDIHHQEFHEIPLEC